MTGNNDSTLLHPLGKSAPILSDEIMRIDPPLVMLSNKGKPSEEKALKCQRFVGTF